jgi:hypothetical protein
MSKRLFAICVASVLVTAGSSSAQSTTFLGFGITCHKGYVGAPGAAFPTVAPSSAFPMVAPASAFPTAVFPAAAFPTPVYYQVGNQPSSAPPSSAPPANNTDLASAIDRLTAAITTLSGKMGTTTPTTTPKTEEKIDGNKKDSKLNKIQSDERKKISSLVAEAEALRGERSKPVDGVAAR